MLAPVIDDLAYYLMPGRVKGGAAGHGTSPYRCIEEAVEAERLGIRSGFLTERWDLKDSPALLGGSAAMTSRIELGTSPIVTTSRPALVTASFAATMQATYGERFVLGLGRGVTENPGGQGLHPFGTSFQAFEDYVTIVKRLLRGETVTYKGPAGELDNMRLLDTHDGEPPEVWSCSLGGPVASRVAARCCDGLMLPPQLTPDAVRRAVTTFREERERQELDPNGARVVASVVTAMDMDEAKTLDLTAARFLTYAIGYDFSTNSYMKANGWDPELLKPVLDHPVIRNASMTSADQAYFRSQLVEPAKLVPEEWMRTSCAIGSLDECLVQWKAFKDTGVDQIMLYGSNPWENEKLIAAWRDSKA